MFTENTSDRQSFLPSTLIGAPHLHVASKGSILIGIDRPFSSNNCFGPMSIDNARNQVGLDECRLAALLAEYEQALAAGRTLSELEAMMASEQFDPILCARLRRGQACLRLLNQVWQSKSDAQSVGATDTQSGHVESSQNDLPASAKSVDSVDMADRAPSARIGASTDFRGTDRFLIERRLGAGGMGVVY